MERGIDLTIIVQFQFHPFYQKYLKKLFILYCRVIWTTTTFYIRCSLVSEKNHSTYMPIVHIYDEITTNLQNNDKTLVLYLDLKKAFDTVSIEILLKVNAI